MVGCHNFSTADQGLLGLAVAVRQADKTKEPLPLRKSYCTGEGHGCQGPSHTGSIVTPCPVCDEKNLRRTCRDACWEGAAHTGPDLYARWCVWAYNETKKLKKWRGNSLSADAKAGLRLAQHRGQGHLHVFKRRLNDNGVTGRSDTITLHVAKPPPGDKVSTRGKHVGWDEEGTSLCASDSVLVFIGKVHGVGRLRRDLRITAPETTRFCWRRTRPR